MTSLTNTAVPVTKAALAPPVDARAIYDRIAALVVAECQVDPAKIVPEATFDSLGLKSIDIVMLLTAVEEEFGIYISMDGSMAEARDLGAFIDGIVRRIDPGASPASR